MKATITRKFIIPVEGEKREAIEGNFIIVPDGQPTDGRADGEFVFTRSQTAELLRDWRATDPIARKIPRRLSIPAMIVNRVRQALEERRNPQPSAAA